MSIEKIALSINAQDGELPKIKTNPDTGENEIIVFQHEDVNLEEAVVEASQTEVVAEEVGDETDLSQTARETLVKAEAYDDIFGTIQKCINNGGNHLTITEGTDNETVGNVELRFLGEFQDPYDDVEIPQEQWSEQVIAFNYTDEGRADFVFIKDGENVLITQTALVDRDMGQSGLYNPDVDTSQAFQTFGDLYLNPSLNCE